jgi:hypothetical protein
MAELMRESHVNFKGFIRMDPGMFHELLDRLTPRLTKAHTNWRAPLEPGLKLAVTLRFLATGNSFHSLAYEFRVAHNTEAGCHVEVPGRQASSSGASSSLLTCVPILLAAGCWLTVDGWLAAGGCR